jgi:tetratricopeptide (TPR) repeat protein
MDDTGTSTRATARRADRRAVILPAVIVLVYSVVVSRLPLLNYLGYEYSAALAFFFPLVPGLFMLRAFGLEEGAGRTVFLQAITCLVVPLAVGRVNALFVKNCSPAEGLGWYGLIAGAGMVWIASLAYCCARAFRRRHLWYFILLAVVLLHPLWLGYDTPRVDSYNSIYGFFPGFTYDEDLRIGTVILLWRVVTLVAAAGFFLAGRLVRKRTARLEAVLLAVVVAALCAAWYFRTDLGFETTTASLRRALGSMAETRHFRIYYDSSAIRGDEIRWVAAEHEFRYRQVSRFLETDTNRVVESYIYPDADTKRRLIGAGNTDIAKPWRSEIHLDGGSWRATLKHELTHALAAEFGMPIIRANVNIGLVEGLAMAASPSFGNRTLQEYAASMIHFGIVDDPAPLIRPAGFAFQSSTVSYVLMGAFCDYLIGRYGIRPFKVWYGGGTPEDAYGAGADSLIAAWKSSLAKIRVPESWRAHTEYYFKRKSIFAAECARAIANLNADGDRALGENKYVSAKDMFAEALGESWNVTSFAGLARALTGSGDFGQVVAMFRAGEDDTMKRGSLAAIRLLYGDALLMTGRYGEARDVYAGIRALDLSPGMNEAAALRMVIADAPDLREYAAPILTGTLTDSSALRWLSGIVAPDNPAALSFLKGRLMVATGDYPDAARETAEYFTPFPYPELNGAISDIAANAFFRLGDFLSARVFYEKTLDYHPGSVLAARARDRVERCEWFGREWEGFAVKRGAP